MRVKMTCNARVNSDAIGMGLNLNIDRVVFAEVRGCLCGITPAATFRVAALRSVAIIVTPQRNSTA